MNAPSPNRTALLCYKCARRYGLKYADRFGGTFMLQACQECGEDQQLGEYVVNGSYVEAHPVDSDSNPVERGAWYFAYDGDTFAGAGKFACTYGRWGFFINGVQYPCGTFGYRKAGKNPMPAAELESQLAEARREAERLREAAVSMLDLEARRMYERDMSDDAAIRPCPCPGCRALRAATTPVTQAPPAAEERER